MQTLLELCREFAPIAAVFGSFATVAVIPILRKLDKIDKNVSILSTQFEGHEELDDVRFQAHEQRLNEIASSHQGG